MFDVLDVEAHGEPLAKGDTRIRFDLGEILVRRIGVSIRFEAKARATPTPKTAWPIG